MKKTSVLLCLAAVAGSTLSAAGGTQAPPDATVTEKPDPKVQRGRSLDYLFEALKLAPDNQTARLIERRIWTLWSASGSDTADLLMSRAKQALDEKETDVAVRLLGAVIDLKPDYAEAWNRRATVYFEQKDYARALADIAQVLSREPRHFGALTGLGLILQDMGEEQRALAVFRRALDIDPHLEKVPEYVKTLSIKIEGRDL
jgi:tetratricopeptide (TPR) repeat protein